jgi:hypothetical protein
MSQPLSKISARYIRFAEKEARGRSRLYEELARRVAGDRETIDFLATLAADKQQPNLLFAAVRHLFGTPENWTGFRATLLANREAIRGIMLGHATQTNEPARCAMLLPVLARLPQPLALIEVGASAGLCLLPDLYAYDYGRRRLHPAASDVEPPILTCTASDNTPLPTALPKIAWRAGLDLNPLSAADPAEAAWLETLVWPEQTERLLNLRAASRIAAVVRPRVAKGSLLTDDLERLCREAPANATLVIFHTAVLAYVAAQADRDAFARRAMSLCPCWISNETPGVFPSSAVPAGGAPGHFLMSVNGSAVAWTDPHGAAIEWLREPAQ